MNKSQLVMRLAQQAATDFMGVTMAQLAKDNGVHRSYLSHAKRVDHEAPEMAAAITAGEMTVYRAMEILKKRDFALDGHEPPKRKYKKTKPEPKPVVKRQPRDRLADARNGATNWLVTASRTLSLFDGYDGPIEVRGQFDAHVRDVQELLRRMVPANPGKVDGNGD